MLLWSPSTWQFALQMINQIIILRFIIIHHSLCIIIIMPEQDLCCQLFNQTRKIIAIIMSYTYTLVYIRRACTEVRSICLPAIKGVAQLLSRCTIPYDFFLWDRGIGVPSESIFYQWLKYYGLNIVSWGTYLPLYGVCPRLILDVGPQLDMWGPES